MNSVYFKHEEEGDGTYDGQIGRAYLHLEDGSTGDEGRDLGWLTLAAAADVARDHGADIDFDGPSRDDWDAMSGNKPSFAKRLLGR